jgi:hypothetical protein
MITLTPKEKAKELFDIYWDLLLIHNVLHRKLFTKQCALIAVNEILKCHMWKYNSIEPYKFWQEVKNELENYKNE